MKALVELLELWWFEWRWRMRKMKEKGWRSCSGVGDEGGVGDGEGFDEVVKRIIKWNGEGEVFIGVWILGR